MKCDELKAYKVDVTIPVYGTIADAKVYLKEDVDETIAELKQKLESVQASMYCDVVDANMENRRLRRALWIARAWGANQRTKYLDLFLTGRAHAIRKYKWIKITSKCRAKAEEYK